MAFQRGAGAEGDDRRLGLGAEPDDLGDLLGAVRKGDGVWGVRRVVGFVFAVLLQNRRGGRQAIAEALAQGRQQLRVERDASQDGRVHGWQKRKGGSEIKDLAPPPYSGAAAPCNALYG